MLDIRVVQPAYFSGEKPDETIAEFLIRELEAVRPGGLKASEAIEASQAAALGVSTAETSGAKCFEACEAEASELIVLPEYSNAGGLSDPRLELLALARAERMLGKAAEVAKGRGAYVAINVLESRSGKIKNSTYLFDRRGEVAFVYDKIHLPPSEVALGVERGSGACVCEVDGIRFGFMTCYDVYFNEQVEYIAKQKPDIILIPGYQRGERTDIICAQAKLLAFRCNAYVARSSYSMNDEGRGGNSMIVAPDGQILKNLGKAVGSISATVDPKQKYMRTAGFGGEMIRNDNFINNGLCPSVFGE